ncbi:DsrE family protein [Pararhizobium gei]|uniref:DsrE family protein n=1 Tax=Pararhizobium gei TaxID=1395951 RepID=UPI0023DB6DD5|nr:DsrE family protein [Rhizobium gei]
MTIKRRSIFTRLAAAPIAALFSAGVAGTATAGSGRQKVVYHLADTDKVMFVLGNIRNHLEGMGGAQAVDIVLVVHGPALTLFKTSSANPKLSAQVEAIVSDGVRLAACGNTMTAQNLELRDLPRGFVRVEEGGVVRIARLQEQGYLYLRP